jgi:hypothetical protein
MAKWRPDLTATAAGSTNAFGRQPVVAIGRRARTTAVASLHLLDGVGESQVPGRAVAR